MTTPLNDSITLGQAPGTVDEIVRIADGAPVALEKAALDNMARVSSRIQRAIEQGQTIYGLTTGVGDLVTTRLSPDRMTDTQLNMLRSHACGVGPDLTVREVRAMMAVTLKSLLQGYSGVTPALAQRIADMLNRQVSSVCSPPPIWRAGCASRPCGAIRAATMPACTPCALIPDSRKPRKTCAAC